MKEYITIHNIGPLKKIDRLEIAPFTVLIGEFCYRKEYAYEGDSY